MSSPCQARSIKDKPRNLARGPVFLSPGELHFHSPRLYAFKPILIIVMTGQEKKCSDNLLSISSMKDKTFKGRSSSSGLKDIRRHSLQGHISFHWSDLKPKKNPLNVNTADWSSGGQWWGLWQRYHSARESMTVVATVCLCRRKRGYDKEEGLWEVGLDGRGVQIGLLSHGVRVCLRGKVTGRNGSNEVWREGTVLGSRALGDGPGKVLMQMLQPPGFCLLHLSGRS